MSFFDCGEGFCVVGILGFGEASGVEKLVGGAAESGDDDGELFAVFEAGSDD